MMELQTTVHLFRDGNVEMDRWIKIKERGSIEDIFEMDSCIIAACRYEVLST